MHKAFICLPVFSHKVLLIPAAGACITHKHHSPQSAWLLVTPFMVATGCRAVCTPASSAADEVMQIATEADVAVPTPVSLSPFTIVSEQPEFNFASVGLPGADDPSNNFPMLNRAVHESHDGSGAQRCPDGSAPVDCQADPCLASNACADDEQCTTLRCGGEPFASMLHQEIICCLRCTQLLFRYPTLCSALLLHATGCKTLCVKQIPAAQELASIRVTTRARSATGPTAACPVDQPLVDCQPHPCDTARCPPRASVRRQLLWILHSNMPGCCKALSSCSTITC